MFNWFERCKKKPKPEAKKVHFEESQSKIPSVHSIQVQPKAISPTLLEIMQEDRLDKIDGTVIKAKV